MRKPSPDIFSPSDLDFQRRGGATFNQVVTQTDGETNGNLLIVAHAGVNRVILGHILEMPLRNIFRLTQGHACLNTLIQVGDGFRIVGLNQAAA